jgi:hypothetical protein
MNTEANPDALDRLLGDFFKGQMKQPWPPAPHTGSFAEPALRNAVPDHGLRSRLTLAASVAILLGSCWYLTSDSPGGSRGGTNQPGSGGTLRMNDLKAEPGKGGILDKVKEIKATQPKTDPADAPMPSITDPFGKQP